MLNTVFKKNKTVSFFLTNFLATTTSTVNKQDRYYDAIVRHWEKLPVIHIDYIKLFKYIQERLF